MNITLKDYNGEHEAQILHYIIAFFEAHHMHPTETDAREDLANWTDEGHDFYEILGNGALVGFIHICMRGSNVCWIEDIFVDEHLRRQGIASKAIGLIEKELQKRNVKGICMDVVPDNLPALKLYHRLGYDRLSMITVRKDMQSFITEHSEQICDLKFRVMQFED